MCTENDYSVERSLRTLRKLMERITTRSGGAMERCNATRDASHVMRKRRNGVPKQIVVNGGAMFRGHAMAHNGVESLNPHRPCKGLRCMRCTYCLTNGLFLL